MYHILGLAMLFASVRAGNRWTKENIYENTVVNESAMFPARSLLECAQQCADNCQAFSHSKTLQECHIYHGPLEESMFVYKNYMQFYIKPGMTIAETTTSTTTTTTDAATTTKTATTTSPSAATIVETTLLSTECPPAAAFAKVILSGSNHFTIAIYKTKVAKGVAESICKEANSKLVKIDTVEKQMYLLFAFNFCPGYKGDDYWIDGSNINAPDYTSPDAWTLSDTSLLPMDDAIFWAPGAPTLPGSEHCVRMREVVGYMWDDQMCSMQFAYICELDD